MRSSDMTHSSTRFFVAASITILVVLFAYSTKVFALSCMPRNFSLNEAYAVADSVIVGLVTECKQEVSSEPWANGGVECSFVSLEVLKESKPASDYAGVASSSGCGLSLVVGRQYLLFLDRENNPIRYSAGLSDDQNGTAVSGSYVRILRDFKDGTIQDLSDPWLFREHEDSCSVTQNVGGHSIGFNSRNGGTSESTNQDWTKEMVDGKTIIRGKAKSVGSGSGATNLAMDYVVVSDVPEYPLGASMLSVTVPEREPAPKRRVTITVSGQSWQLYRTETSLSMGGRSMHTQISYQVGGSIAEQIFSAMSTPSDVIVSAVLDDPTNAKSELQNNPPQLEQTPEFRAEPRLGSTITPSPDGGGTARQYSAEREPPEPIIRFETRSTQFAAAADRFLECYEDLNGSQK